jgi:hypothetical protein
LEPEGGETLNGAEEANEKPSAYAPSETAAESGGANGADEKAAPGADTNAQRQNAEASVVNAGAATNGDSGAGESAAALGNGAVNAAAVENGTVGGFGGAEAGAGSPFPVSGSGGSAGAEGNAGGGGNGNGNGSGNGNAGANVNADSFNNFTSASAQDASPKGSAFAQHVALAASDAAGQTGVAHAARRAFPELATEFYDALAREARLVLKGEKHEFMMQLKPENLGKVTLQIMTERGAVNARFIVDNELARANLESNIGHLKNALNEQGLSVQGCMVEVRQGGDNRAAHSEVKNADRRARNTAARAGEITSAAIDAGRRAFLRDRYFDELSSVHFTA